MCLCVTYEIRVTTEWFYATECYTDTYAQAANRDRCQWRGIHRGDLTHECCIRIGCPVDFQTLGTASAPIWNLRGPLHSPRPPTPSGPQSSRMQIWWPDNIYLCASREPEGKGSWRGSRAMESSWAIGRDWIRPIFRRYSTANRDPITGLYTSAWKKCHQACDTAPSPVHTLIYALEEVCRPIPIPIKPSSKGTLPAPCRSVGFPTKRNPRVPSLQRSGGSWVRIYLLMDVVVGRVAPSFRERMNSNPLRYQCST